ncbi:flagellar biosynthesis protein FlhF [Nocardia suismassiliense]|uniref:hypothetical protein n=1 Tax=Nocardia suismassiliense TaxID=2077092 RepID=UPI00131F0361|nr:hypothetical protein [Nocardia suismassiliense]
MTLPEWVEDAAKLPRVPIGQVVSWCRWPLELSEQIEISEGDTLASVAAGAYPIRCLACHSEHRIDELTDNPDPDLQALKHVACPTCGTVGLWPPNRPVRELKWANKDLWDAYGSDGPLPQGEPVLVPRLCGHEVLQRKASSRQPTYCEQALAGTRQAHISGKASDERDALVKKAAEAAREMPPAPVHGLVLVPAPADDVEEEGPQDGAESPVEASVVEVAEMPAVEALEAVRVELAAARRLAADAAVRVSRADEKFGVLAEAVARERAELERRCAAAEKQASDARQELEGVKREVAAAEDAQRRAEVRAELLAEQVDAVRRGELQEVVASALDRLGSRRGAGDVPRVSKTQLKMILGIGSGRLIVIRDVAGERWFIDGKPVANGPIKTLDSLLERNLIGGWSEDAEYARVQLIGEGVNIYRKHTDSEPVEVSESADLVVEDGIDSDAVPDPDAAVVGGWKPIRGAVDKLLNRVGVGGVGRRADRSWRFEGGGLPPIPAIQHLNWMLKHDRIHVKADGSVHVTERDVEGG